MGKTDIKKDYDIETHGHGGRVMIYLGNAEYLDEEPTRRRGETPLSTIVRIGTRINKELKHLKKALTDKRLRQSIGEYDLVIEEESYVSDHYVGIEGTITVNTIEDAKKVVAILEEQGLIRGKDSEMLDQQV